MERLALRVATVAALLNGGIGPWPTLAGEFVYDSMMDNIVDIVRHRSRPVIVVRTDQDGRMYKTSQFAGRQCNLLIEISVVSAVTEKVNGTEQLKLDWPKTDPALEAMLDILEWQVWVGLMGSEKWASWYHTARTEGGAGYGDLLRYTSTPRYSPPERGVVRLAVRTLEFLTNLPKECVPPPLHEFDPVQPPFYPPNLKYIVDYILTKGGGAYRESIVALGKMIQTYGQVQRPRMPALQRVWAGFPQYEFEADWKIEQAAQFQSESVVTDPATVTQPSLN